VFITEHLPKLFFDQKMALHDRFKQARKQKKKTSWRIINSQYCLFIDNEKIEPPLDFISSRRNESQANFRFVRDNAPSCSYESPYR